MFKSRFIVDKLKNLFLYELCINLQFYVRRIRYLHKTFEKNRKIND